MAPVRHNGKDSAGHELNLTEYQQAGLGDVFLLSLVSGSVGASKVTVLGMVLLGEVSAAYASKVKWLGLMAWPNGLACPAFGACVKVCAVGGMSTCASFIGYSIVTEPMLRLANQL
jgi:hypothetical protein